MGKQSSEKPASQSARQAASLEKQSSAAADWEGLHQHHRRKLVSLGALWRLCVSSRPVNAEFSEKRKRKDRPVA